MKKIVKILSKWMNNNTCVKLLIKKTSINGHSITIIEFSLFKT
jgi:hypothetical protein